MIDRFFNHVGLSFGITPDSAETVLTGMVKEGMNHKSPLAAQGNYAKTHVLSKLGSVLATSIHHYKPCEATLCDPGRRAFDADAPWLP